MKDEASENKNKGPEQREKERELKALQQLGAQGKATGKSPENMSTGPSSPAFTPFPWFVSPTFPSLPNLPKKCKQPNKLQLFRKKN